MNEEKDTTNNLPASIAKNLVLTQQAKEALGKRFQEGQIKRLEQEQDDIRKWKNAEYGLQQTVNTIHDMNRLHQGQIKGGYEVNANIENPSGNIHVESSNKAGSSCYVATATYQDAYHPNVVILRDFRDRYLRKWEWGKAFIFVYYSIGRYLAIFPEHSEFVRNLSKKVIDKIVQIIVNKYYLK